MTLLCRIVIAFAIGLGISNHALAQSSFGSFAGVVTNQKLNKDQLVKLELIHMSEESGSIQLRALLTLQLGGFESGEYVTYHFENVIFNVVTGVIAFNQTDQEVYLSDVALKNGVLTGDLNASNGHIGPVKLSSRTTIQPQNELVQPLGGEYSGQCGTKPSSLQLFTFRSTLDTTRLGNPLGAYEAKGQLGQFNPGYCSGKKTEHCTYAKIESASYNFFNGDLVLKGFPFSYSCQVKGSKVDCGECQFTRTSNEMKSPMLETRRYAVDPIDVIEKQLRKTASRSLRGNFSGYIFHENLDIFQKVRLDITTYDKVTDSGIELTISTVATVKFGDLENEEITYKFDPVPLPNPVLPPRVILSRPQDDVDPEVKINSIMGGVIRGTWNSNIFGRVGSFVVTRNGDLPELPEARLMKSISSGYEEVGGKRFIANLIIAKGNAPIGSDNPYYPLTMNGYVWRRVQSGMKDPITGGSYDFYTGKIAVLFGDQKTLTGFIKTGDNARLRRLGGGFGTLMQEFAPMEYRKTNKLPR